MSGGATWSVGSDRPGIESRRGRSPLGSIDERFRRVKQGEPKRGKVPNIEGYEIYEAIGSGAMGTVFRARHLAMDRVVALKIIRRSLSRSKQQVDRLAREARLVASLDHPNIVRGFDFGESGGYHYLSMEYVAGRSVREILKERLFDEAEALDVTEKVARALGHASELGVIHRDIKPANLMLTWDGDVKLADLGLAKGPANVALTHSGATIGTPQYLSPEQAQDPRHVDHRSDYYSLGATLFHMVTGRPPFSGEGIGEVIAKVLFSEAEAPRSLRPELSPSFSNLILRLMAKDPASRPQNSSGLLSLVERVRKGLPVDVPSFSGTAKRTFGSKLAFGLAGVAVLALGFVVLPRFFESAKEVESGGDRVGLESSRVPDLEQERAGTLRELEGRVSSASGSTVFDLIREVGELEENWRETGGSKNERSPSLDRLVRVRASLSGRFDEAVNRVFAEMETRARSRVEKGEEREALAVFSIGLEESEFARELGRIFGRSLDDLPEDLLARVERRREEGENRVRARVSRLRAEGLSAELTGIAGMKEVASAVRVLNGLESGYRSDRDLLLASDDFRLGDRFEQVRSDLHRRWVAVYVESENQVLDLVEQRRFRSARQRLQRFGEDGIFEEIPRLISRQEDLIVEVEERERDTTLSEEEQHQEFTSRFPTLIRKRNFSRAADLLRERLGSLAPLREESDRIGVVVSETEAAGRELELLVGLFSRVEEKVAASQGKKVRLSVRGNRNLREILEVKDKEVRYRFSGSGNVSTFSLYELDVSEIRRLAPVRTGHPQDAAALGLLMLDEAASVEDVAGKTRSLTQARADLELSGSKVEEASDDGVRGWLPEFLSWALAQVDTAGREAQLRGRKENLEAEGAFNRAEEKFLEAQWEASIAAFQTLRDERRYRGFYLARRAEIDEKLEVAERSLQLRTLASRFQGQVSAVSGDKRKIKISYDFENAKQLEDWGKGGFRVEEGRLVGRDPSRKKTGAEFKAESGLIHTARFDLFRGLSLEFDFITREDVAPLFAGFSMMGNTVGVLSRRQSLTSRQGQINVWIGGIGAYEDHLHFEGRLLREPRGVEEYFFEADRTYRVGIRIAPYAQSLRMEVDGEVVLERDLVKPSRSGPIEIRTWFGHRIDNLVLEGVIVE